MAEVQVTVDDDGTLMLSIPLDSIPLEELLRCVMAARRGHAPSVEPEEVLAPDPPRKRRGKKASDGPAGVGTRRAQVVELLNDGEPHQASELARHMGITQDGVGYHLRALARAGKVVREGSSTNAVWRLS